MFSAETRTDKHTKNPQEQECDDEIASRNSCPECDGETTPLDHRGEIICMDCGLVIEEARLESCPDARFTLDEGHGPSRRCGAPSTTLMHDYGLSTTIGRKVDGRGNPLSSKQKRIYNRLRTWNARCEADRFSNDGLRYCANEVKRIGAGLNLGTTAQRTAMGYLRQSMEEEIILGRSYEAFIGAAMYLAAREHDAVRPIPSIVELSRVDADEIEQCVFVLQRELEMGVRPPEPVEYLPWVINKIRDSVSETTRRSINWRQLQTKGRVVLKQIQSDGRGQGCSPVVLAGAVTYYLNRDLSSSGQLIQEDIAEAVEISKVSIQNNRELVQAVATDAGLESSQLPA
jgi:transcription initiation factor TFIIB